MASGGNLEDIRGNAREMDPWLQRIMGKLSTDSQGISNINSQPGQSSIGLRGNVGRGAYSPIASSSWREVLGLQPTASYSGGENGGGDTRVNTARSAMTYRGKSDLADTDSVQGYSKDGSIDYGGVRKTFSFTHGDSDAANIAESGKIGLRATDRSGQSVAVNPMSNLSEDQSWSKYGSLGGNGWSSEQGRYSANLENPSDRVVFNNRISQDLAGAGNVNTTTLGESEGNVASRTLSDVSRAIPFLGKLPLIGDAFKSYDREKRTQYNVDTAAQQAIESGGYLNEPGKAEYSIQSEGGINQGMKTPGVFDGILSQSSVQGDQSGRISTGRGGAGYLQQQNYGVTSGGAELQRDEHQWKKILGGEKQNETIRGGPTNLQAEAGLLTNAGVSSNNALQSNISQDWINTNINPEILNNWETYKKRYPSLASKYQDLNDYIKFQYAKANPQNTVEFSNQSTATQSAAGNGVSSTVQANANAAGKLEASGNGVTGDFQQAVNSYAQDPSTFVMTPYGTPAYIVGLKHWSQKATTNLTGELKNDSGVLDTLVKIGGNLTSNNELHQEMMRTVEDISSKLPQTEWGQLIINKMQNSPEIALLLNSNSSPETIAKTILNYDVYKDETSSGWNVIPGVGAAPIYGAPQTQSYLNSKTSLEASVPRGQVKELDPTPDNPNSGDEVWVANINGQIQEVGKGKLISQNFKDTLSTDFSVPTGAATTWSVNTSNSLDADEYQLAQSKYDQELKDYEVAKTNYSKDLATYQSNLAKYISLFSTYVNNPYTRAYAYSLAKPVAPTAPVAPVLQTSTSQKSTAQQTPVDVQNQLNYNQYYFTPGENVQYNQLVEAGLNRYYDDISNYDYSGIDPLIAQIQLGVSGAQDGMYGGYSAEDWDYAINLYNQQKQYDDSGYNQFLNSSNVAASQLRYY